MEAVEDRPRAVAMALLGEKGGDFSVEEVLSYFKKDHTESSLPPIRPKGGEVYMFTVGIDSSKKGLAFDSLGDSSLASYIASLCKLKTNWNLR